MRQKSLLSNWTLNKPLSRSLTTDLAVLAKRLTWEFVSKLFALSFLPLSPNHDAKQQQKCYKNTAKILNQWSYPWLPSPCPHILQWWSCPWWSWWGSRPGSPSSPRTPFALSGQNIVLADFKLRVTLILLRTSSIAVGISSALAIGCPLDLSLDPSIYCWPRRISGINFFILISLFFAPIKSSHLPPLPGNWVKLAIGVVFRHWSNISSCCYQLTGMSQSHPQTPAMIRNPKPAPKKESLFFTFTIDKWRRDFYENISVA